MASFFESIFKRNLINVNVYSDSVAPPVKFKQRSVDAYELLYTTLVDVRIIEDYISDGVSKIPVGVYSPSGEELEGTPLNLLIEKSNPEQTWQELLKELLIFYGLTGNGFCLLNDNYLYSLSSSNMHIVLGKSTTVPEFMNFVSGYTLELEGIRYALDPQYVFHMKTASLNGTGGEWAWGTSPYSAAVPNLTSLESNYSSRVSLIRDRAALAFLSNESERPDQEQTQIVQNALNDYGITEGKAKVIATTQKLRYNQMLLGIAELQLDRQPKG